MCFDSRLPFVGDVYRFVERRQLHECVRFLERYLTKQPKTPMHWLVGRDFRGFLPSYSKWLMSCCQTISNPDSKVVVCASLGELEINYNNWMADGQVYRDYDEPDDAYRWLCGSESTGFRETYRLEGLQKLGSAFEYAFDHNDLDPTASSPVPAAVFTAVSYLFFIRFLELNRDTHRIAAKCGNALARCHLFCDYGDLLYHSRPKQSVI